MISERRKEDGTVSYWVETSAMSREFASLEQAQVFVGIPAARQFQTQWLHVVQFAYETAACKREVMEANWSEFDLERTIWTIPACSNGRSRIVPLSRDAMQTLEIMRTMADPSSPRVFHWTKTNTSVRGLYFRLSVKTLSLDCKDFFELREIAASRMMVRMLQAGLSMREVGWILGRHKF